MQPVCFVLLSLIVLSCIFLPAISCAMLLSRISLFSFLTKARSCCCGLGFIAQKKKEKKLKVNLIS